VRTLAPGGGLLFTLSSAFAPEYTEAENCKPPMTSSVTLDLTCPCSASATELDPER
jgi:hypothetical protein